MVHRISLLLFPPKCVLCRKLLRKDETDLCHTCRAETPDFKKANKSIPFLAGWTAVWYYMDNVRQSILRYKFSNARSYADFYGRMLAMRLLQEEVTFDILTWVPTGILRRFQRGYDQVALLAAAVGKEMNAAPVKTLRKIRQVPPQSRIKDISHRRANVLGAYRAIAPESLRGKRILLIDDIITTGSTVSECARVLMTAGAKEVFCAAVAAAPQHKK